MCQAPIPPAVRLALLGVCRNGPFTSIRPSVLVNECVKGMTFMKLMVLFHALNSGLTFFSSLYLFTYFTILGLGEFKSLCSVFKYCIPPDVIYCLRCSLNQCISLSQQYGKIRTLPVFTSLRNITKINEKSIAVFENEVSSLKRENFILQGLKQKCRYFQFL